MQVGDERAAGSGKFTSDASIFLISYRYPQALIVIVPNDMRGRDGSYPSLAF